MAMACLQQAGHAAHHFPCRVRGLREFEGSYQFAKPDEKTPAFGDSAGDGGDAHARHLQHETIDAGQRIGEVARGSGNTFREQSDGAIKGAGMLQDTA
jgi:hypothetical protein